MSTSEVKTITLYDIPGKHAPWSPNIWKARYALNVKGLPHRTVWVEYPDIASTMQSIGAKPSGKWNHDGSDKWTLPTIYDPNTSAVVTDSLEIAKYLDKTYTEHGTSLLNDKAPLHAAFEQLMWGTTIPNTLRLCGYLTGQKLNKASQDYWWKFRALDVGMTLFEFCPQTPEDAAKVWEEHKNGHHKLAALYEEGQVLIGGDKPVYADCVMAAWWFWIRITYGSDSMQWKAVEEWDGGKWVKLLDAMKQYEGEC